MDKTFHERGFEDYQYWQNQDRKTLKRINDLIKDIERNGAAKGIGKPEKLKYSNDWSRRIDEQNRLIYKIENDTLIIKACKGHYDE